jgi:DNA-binding CsgD family transcriptional regulator
MRCPAATTTLVGRERELVAIEALLDGAGERGGALLLRGEPGIGKSALLAEAARCAAAGGLRVLSAAGVQSEANLPFAGLHQLLRPVLSGDGPAEPRATVLAAFGVGGGVAPEPFRIALAALDLLADAAADGPLLLLADDLQWIDRPSLDVLAFVARRLESDPIVLLGAARAGGDALEDSGLPELRLGTLDDESAGALLDGGAPGLAPALRERLLAAAAGNPLALEELPLAAGRLGVEAGPGEWLPLTERLEHAFADRASELPEPTRALLLVAAEDDGGVLAEVLAATAALTLVRAGLPPAGWAGLARPLEALEPALAAGLVAVEGDALRFRHPLVRSALHQAAGLADRLAAHAALAEVLRDQPDRRVWHLAAATVEPDEAVAGELEAAARSAQRRGAALVAVAALERAARLSPDPGARGSRLLWATEAAYELGRHDLVARLLAEADPLALGDRERLRLAWLRELFEEGPWSGAARLESFARIADVLAADGDPGGALDRLVPVAFRCWWSNAGADACEAVVEAAERTGAPDTDPRLLAVLALAAPVERGAQVLERLPEVSRAALEEPVLMLHLANGAGAVGAYDQAARIVAVSTAGLRAQGRLGLLVQALVAETWAALHTGKLELAGAAAEEAVRLARETAQPRWSAAATAGEAVRRALRGDHDEAIALAAEAEAVILPMAAHPMLALVQYARGLAALGAGRHADAFAHLRRIYDPADLAFHRHLRTWAAGELAEAAAHSGNEAHAEAAVRELERVAARAPSPMLLAGLASARAQLAGDEHAEAHYLAGLGGELSSYPRHRAALLLAYGAWLRRRRRVAESRAPLRAARDTFDALGILPWGERARQELRASGEASGRRAPEARDQLTPQELQIAQMAARGMSNREIGQTLYLSHRTVSSHLYRLFPKLGITSRIELRDALEAS